MMWFHTSSSLIMSLQDDYWIVQLTPGVYSGKDYDPQLKWTPRADLPAVERPSDALLRAHFQQALLRFVLRLPCSIDLIDAFNRPGNNAFDVDLSHARWVTGEGKALLEHHLMQRLFSLLPAVVGGSGRETTDVTSRTVLGADGALKRKRSDSAGARASPASPFNDDELWFDTFKLPLPAPVQYAEINDYPPYPDMKPAVVDSGTRSSSGDSNGSGSSPLGFLDHEIPDTFLDDAMYMNNRLVDRGSVDVTRTKVGTGLDDTATSSEDTGILG
jgi:hypothetical protein